MSETPRFPVYRLLGKSGLRVHPLCLGTMTFGEDALFGHFLGSATPNAEAEQIVISYLSMGGNFIDTADFYQRGKSEEFIATTLAKNEVDRDDLVLGTKFSLPMNRGPNYCGNHKKHMLKALEECLRRLNTNYIDLFYVHFWDWSTPVEEVMRALNDCVRAGKIHHIGFSNIPAWIMTQANERAAKFGWEPVTAYQGRYSLCDRAMERTIFPACQSYDVGGVAWGAIGGGKLTGRRTRENRTGEGTEAQRTNVQMTELDFDIQDVVMEIADEKGRSAAQIAYRWVVQKPGVTSALVGARALRHWEDNVGVMEFELSEEEMGRLDAVSKRSPPLIFPFDWNGTSVSDSPLLQLGAQDHEKFTIE